MKDTSSTAQDPNTSTGLSSGRSGAKEKVCIIGSGNWGTTIARIVGETVRSYSDLFEDQVVIWVYEEVINGRKLSEIINTDHENVKYLPGFKIPHNVIAVPELEKAVTGASCLIFVLPHQFLPGLLPVVKASMRSDARAISLIKGVDFDEEGPVLISDIIRQALGVDVSVLMGANVANEIAEGQFCESTIGTEHLENGSLWKKLLSIDTFRCEVALDAQGVEICGALKNVIALGAGFCDGLGYGTNTKAAIIRIGLLEMKRFAYRYLDGIRDETFFESCGVADLITTCFGGRNRKVAEAYVKTRRGWSELESELLGGQKLQGTLTASEVYKVLEKNNQLEEFPLMAMIYRIAFENEDPGNIVKFQAYTHEIKRQGSKDRIGRLLSTSSDSQLLFEKFGNL